MGTLNVGLNCHTYVNTGTYGSPVWTEIAIIKDDSLNLELTKAEAFSREYGWKMYLQGLAAAPIETKLLGDTAGAEYDTIKAAALAGTVLDLAISSQPIATSGAEYFRADYYCFGFKRSQNLEESAAVDVTFDLAYSSHTPGFTTAS